MVRKSFFREFRERAAFIIGMAIANPLILTGYTLFFRDEASSVFWAVGMGVTTIVCVVAAAIIAVRLHFDRRRRHRREAMAEKWREILPGDQPGAA